MADYPGTIPTLDITKSAVATLDAANHTAHHNEMADEINAIAGELGTNPSGGESTVGARIATAFARANHTGTQAASTITALPFELGINVSNPTDAITTGTNKTNPFRLPAGVTLTGVRASLKTASSSGVVTVDINEGGTSVLSTKLTIDANEKTSETAATAAVISDSALADDAEITIDIDTAGTGAVGLVVWLIGTRA